MRAKKSISAIALLSLIALVVLATQRFINLEFLVDRESALRALIIRAPWRMAIAAMMLYTIACVVPGFSGKSIAVGWLFGFWCGTLIINLGGTIAAVLVFTVSRSYFREALTGRYMSLVTQFEATLRKEGPFLLFSLRMIPIVPYTLLNPLAALTSMRATTFAWVTLVGMLPSNGVCAFAGASLPDLREIQNDGLVGFLKPQLILAFLLLAVFPWVARHAFRYFGAGQCHPQKAGPKPRL